MSNSSESVRTIAVFSSDFGGFYLGELVNQIRQLCMLKRYRFVAINTQNYGSFKSAFQSAEVDGIIVIRNALSAEQVEYYLGLNIPIVSIAYDYFPSKVPVVRTNNIRGVELAYAYLKERGHSAIGFVGDISHYDTRMRYEAYCELVEKDNISIDEDSVVFVSNFLASGGIYAAEKYIERKCAATAVIFGSGLTAIGFDGRFNRNTSEPIEIVAFDAIPTMPVVCPNVTSVDQNLHLLAYTALSTVEKTINGKDFKRENIVEPKLLGKDSDYAPGVDAYIATCVECDALYNPNYMKSLIANIYEWPMDIANTNFNSLMSISHVFEKFMALGVLSRFYRDKRGEEYTKVMKILSSKETLNVSVNDGKSLCKSANFPPPILNSYHLEDYDITTHFIIKQEDRMWGVLTLYGCSETKALSSYLAFSGYIQNAVKLFIVQRELGAVKKMAGDLGEVEEPVAEQDPRERTATVVWDVKSAVTSWSDAALELLGMQTDVERNVYRHMNIADRMLQEDAEAFREEFAEKMKVFATFSMVSKFKYLKSEGVKVNIYCHPKFDENQLAENVKFYLSVMEE